ncbi:MAG: hypothetical protein ACF787_14360, partial [Rhodopirellula sp. JB053]
YQSRRLLHASSARTKIQNASVAGSGERGGSDGKCRNGGGEDACASDRLDRASLLANVVWESGASVRKSQKDK